jgi:hypothetical protein
MCEIVLHMFLQLQEALLCTVGPQHHLLHGTLVLLKNLMCVIKLHTQPPQVLEGWKLGSEASQVHLGQGWQEGGLAGYGGDILVEPHSSSGRTVHLSYNFLPIGKKVGWGGPLGGALKHVL